MQRDAGCPLGRLVPPQWHRQPRPPVSSRHLLLRPRQHERGRQWHSRRDRMQTGPAAMCKNRLLTTTMCSSQDDHSLSLVLCKTAFFSILDPIYSEYERCGTWAERVVRTTERQLEYCISGRFIYTCSRKMVVDLLPHF